MKRKQVAVGVDIGGTKIRAGVVDAQGAICGRSHSIPTCSEIPGDVIVRRLIALLRDTLCDAEDYQVKGIGVGCTGPIDLQQGTLLEVDNLPTLSHFPLRKVLEESLQVKVVMENDANAYILAESLWGAGRNADTILGFTLGTGIGCAWIEHGKIWHGNRDCAGEIWTSPYREGILEDYLSGNALCRLCQQYTGRRLTGSEIASLARGGDEAAMQVWHEFSQALAYALSWTVNMLDPQVVVVGGSVVKSSDLFWEQTDMLFRRYVCRPVADSVPLRQAALGDDAGYMGAAALVF